MAQKYTDEFKLAVVKEYYEGNLGVRLLARKYNLPSKNYITNWIKHFKEIGAIPKASAVSRISLTSSKEISKGNAKTAYEKQLEKKLAEAEAKLAFYQKYDEILKRNKKK